MSTPHKTPSYMLPTSASKARRDASPLANSQDGNKMSLAFILARPGRLTEPCQSCGYMLPTTASEARSRLPTPTLRSQTPSSSSKRDHMWTEYGFNLPMHIDWPPKPDTTATPTPPASHSKPSYPIQTCPSFSPGASSSEHRKATNAAIFKTRTARTARAELGDGKNNSSEHRKTRKDVFDFNTPLKRVGISKKVPDDQNGKDCDQQYGDEKNGNGEDDLQPEPHGDGNDETAAQDVDDDAESQGAETNHYKRPGVTKEIFFLVGVVLLLVVGWLNWFSIVRLVRE
ncbi:hypothetical protein QBC35DRAFT_456044 [Podospora australis]|uniref:Uncharacterized protein n=1 Tax=Podospora australis TaxID=1536484 RepID=A0AAN7AF80_9PEZI|nr:hypothetical protein QBC35DRAFT_456044 [Podospora australis]